MMIPSEITEQKSDVAISDKNSHLHFFKFLVGDSVFARNYATGSKWLPAKVISN